LEKGEDMGKGKILQFESYDELVEYFDTHDMSEFIDESREVSFEVNIQRRKCVLLLDEDIMKDLDEIAKKQETTVEDLLNSWIKEKISLYEEK